ncbi:MAG TPA: MFS transporter [Pirellulaceae bacterium]|nr:MFS transporter [Pirellulaceae bacterium]
MNGIRWKLSVMMFLEFFIWGAWLPLSFSYFGATGLNFEGWQQDLLNFAFPVAAILAMFFANQFVDRNFAAERFLAVSQLIGGLAMLGFGYLAWSHFSSGNEGPAPNFWLYFALMAVHCLFYVPTFSVTNALAFANLKDPQKDFGPVRLWGTIGWIAASWPFIFLLVDWDKVNAAETNGFVEWLGLALGTALTGTALNTGKAWAFIVSGFAAILLAGFSLTLPHTPPKPIKHGENSLAWLEAMKLLKHPFLLVLFIVTFIDATVHDGFFFFAFTYLEKVGVPSNWIQPAMSVGQIAEIVTMAGLGYVLKTLGWRYTMIVGILGHALRFAVFAFLPDPIFVVGVNIVHGICYAFFFATLYIFVDEFFPKDARTSAQGLFNFLIFGMGPIASRFVWRSVQDSFTTDGVVNYSSMFLVPSGTALVAAVLLFLFFHPPKVALPETVGH